MRVLYLAGRELDYPRNDVLLRALRRQGTVEAVGETGPGSILRRSLKISLYTLPRLLKSQYDLVFVGFYGHFLMLPVGMLTRQPIVFDAFLSTYDTLCFDRGRFTPRSLPGRLAFWLDQTTCRLATQVLLDTQEHVAYFAQTFGLSTKQLHPLPVGCNEEIFYPRPVPEPGKQMLVLYYSSYLPLHGVETIIRAAAILGKQAIHFRLIGTGQEYHRVRQLAKQLDLKNVTFIPPVPLTSLPNEIAKADICLGGHFGSSLKAQRVIPGKIYQILAMARPLIAADTSANRALLSHGETAYLCPPNNANALAAAILDLHQNASLREHLAANSYLLYLAQCSETIITTRLQQIINSIR